MKEDVLVPSVGESVTSGVLTAWLRREGETVEEGEDLFELETDKATVAVPAPAAGVLAVLVAAGQEVQIGQVVGTLEAAGGEPAAPAPAGVPAAAVSGAVVEAPAAKTAPAPAAAPAPVPSGTPRPGEGQRTRRVPMSRLRQVAASRLVQARHETALLTTFNEVDMQRVLDLRKSAGAQFEAAHGVRLGLLGFFVRAACRALAAFPVLNARIEGAEIVYHDYHDIGVAVSTDRGLLVPVLRDADRMSLAQIEKAVADLARRAREKKIGPDELSGGTFSITNGGVFGSLLSTPLPNYPQSAILGLHAIQKRPVVVGEAVAVRPMMYVALSYDHRLIDGREAVQFLVKVKQLVEDPERLLLEV